MRPLTLSLRGWGLAGLLLAPLLLTGCGEADPAEAIARKIAAGHDAAPRNTQTEARAMFDALCAVRGFSDPDCSCMRDRMLRAGTQAMAYAGASYGGDLGAAAAIGAQMDAAGRSGAVAAYLAAETACLARAPAPAFALDSAPPEDGEAPPPEAPPVARASLADVRASCRPAMAEICACRAQALQRTVGEGAYEAAIAINQGARAQLMALAAGREEGWADIVAGAYARTSAPCVLEATQRR